MKPSPYNFVNELDPFFAPWLSFRFDSKKLLFIFVCIFFLFVLLYINPIRASPSVLYLHSLSPYVKSKMEKQCSSSFSNYSSNSHFATVTFSQMKNYCTLFTGLKNCFPPAYLSFFFFFSFCTIFSLSPFSFPSLCSPLSPLFSIDGFGSLLILETDLGLPAWWRSGSRRGGMGNGLGFSVDFWNGLGGVVVDGVVAWALGTGAFEANLETHLGSRWLR